LRSDWDHIELLESLELLCARAHGWKAADRRMRALYRIVAEEHSFASPASLRSHLRRKRQRLGIQYPLPRDALAGNWAAYRFVLTRRLLERGLQLELFPRRPQRTGVLTQTDLRA
jgi:hypothetical protein